MDVALCSRRIPFRVAHDAVCVHGSLDGLCDGDFLEFCSVGFRSSPVPALVVALDISLAYLAQALPAKYLAPIARAHGIRVGSAYQSADSYIALFAGHQCSSSCTHIISHLKRPEFSAINPFRRNIPPPPEPPGVQDPFAFPSSASFPPTPLSSRAKMEIIRNWTKDLGDALIEAPCAVCAELIPKSNLISRDAHDKVFDMLLRLDASVAVCERAVASDVLRTVQEPILDNAGKFTSSVSQRASVCKSCDGYLVRGKVPPRSLANGLWIGAVPPCLQNLTYAEKLLIACYRHNAFVVAVRMGQRRMRANAVTFSQPVAKVFTVLPPPREEMSDCLAILFIGSCQPTAEDLKRTPLLVRRDVVWNALLWLRANHADYHDIVLSRDNLNEYSEDEPPVSIIYRQDSSPGGGLAPETLAVFDDGTENGPCSFAVHALSSEHMMNMSRDQRIAEAVRHLRGGGKVLAYGHADKPETIYHNPRLLPGMFPWLFPYGLGGLENTSIATRLGRVPHIQHLLDYHDRRFQEDEYFVFVLYSHNQIRGTSLGGYLLTKRKNFTNVAEKILTVDPSAFDALVARGERDGFVLPSNDKEKRCFELLHFVDHVAGHVPNSTTLKRRQRYEIKSLIYHCRTPVFFITFSPADIKSPICMYYAGVPIDISSAMPSMPDTAERLRAVARNPVACAKFFHLMVTMFIKHILRWDTNSDGLFGRVSAYYATVEAQGRMTLHLHMLVWIASSLSPQEIRDRAMNCTEFQEELKAWLESCCVAEFSGGSMQDVSPAETRAPLSDDIDPTLQLPASPPPSGCSDLDVETYMQAVSDTVNQLVLQNHVHACGVHCQRDGGCRARFPRTIHAESSFDELGALHLKHKEPMINTFTPVLDFVMRCNTDSTSLLSGTQVRAVVAYVTDYVTKYQLKTYTLFDVIRSVFDKHSEIVNATEDRAEAARKLMNKIVNALNAKLETGGPMICANLLGHPDHYTGHQFKPFFWYPYLRYVADSCNVDLGGQVPSPDDDQVALGLNSTARIVVKSKVHDYIYRPRELSDWSLYDFIRLSSIHHVRSHKRDAGDDVDSDAGSNAGDSGGLEDDSQDGVDRADVDGADLGDVDSGDEPDAPLGDGGLCPPAPAPARKRYDFLPEHPSHGTHAVHVAEDCGKIVVNFLGNAIPRELESEDIYCLTMLMLFKPSGWRCGSDLKSGSLLWRQTFEATNFSPRSRQIMANINLLYQCTDARHDYAAQRRMGGNATSQFLASLCGQELNALDIQLLEDEAMPREEPDVPDEVPLKGRAANVRVEMDDAAGLMRGLVGSADNVAADEPPAGDWSLSTLPDYNPAQWTDLLNAEKEQLLAGRNAPDTQGSSTVQHPAADLSSTFTPNVVCVISPGSCSGSVHSDYLQSAGEGLFSDTRATSAMREICAHYTLNREQIRAFVTIATSVTSTVKEQLLMYLGGMGGTGKSQVIKALTGFFQARGERRRLSLMAPTGAAACLINGSTYHSMLRLRRGNGGLVQSAVEKIKSNLAGVDVLFFDEVSMISCSDLQAISSNLSAALRCSQAFGGLHVVLAGDFCQLSPAGFGSVTLYSRKPVSAGTNKAQHRALGSALWQQFTTVVILRNNMRQKGMSTPDRQLREALARLRVRACNADDIALFRSRVAGRSASAPCLLHPSFDGVSVITGRNSHRDAINEFQSHRFAQRRGQVLVPFYSRDKMARGSGSRRGSHMQSKLQNELWDVPTCMVSSPIPGILRLCRGMPIMIKQNVATELGVTNGAEATVVSWIACTTLSQKLVLEVLFVELTNPAFSVQLPNLPPNVVPLTPRTESVKVQLLSGSSVSISRTQIPIIPNFAMTDYASQGRTRPFNPVDLRYCWTHQSVYTCLSRGSSLDGILILRDFDERILYGGVSGDLREELLELEYLDDISSLKYNGSLDPAVRGVTRKQLIRTFRLAYGSQYTPIHAGELQPSAKRSHPPRRDHHSRTKRAKVSGQASSVQEASAVPRGLRWDSTDYSCAYDSFLTVVLNGFKFFPSMWKSLQGGNPAFDYFLSSLARASQSTSQTRRTPSEIARDDLRDVLHNVSSRIFPRRGPNATPVSDLVGRMTKVSQAFAHRQNLCTHCGFNDPELLPVSDLLWDASPVLFGSAGATSTASLFQQLIHGGPAVRCGYCQSVGWTSGLAFSRVPSLLMLELPLEWTHPVLINDEFNLPIADVDCRWALQGVIYFGSNHYTCRFLDDEDTVWYHDGAESGTHCLHDGDSISKLQDINIARNRSASILVYRRMEAS